MTNWISRKEPLPPIDERHDYRWHEPVSVTPWTILRGNGRAAFGGVLLGFVVVAIALGVLCVGAR